MKIIQPKAGLLDGPRIKQALPRLLMQPLAEVSPPCPGCMLHLPESCSSKSYSWHVVLSDFGQTWETTYTLEPNLNRDHEVHLDKLQGDLNTLGDNLCHKLKDLARTALATLP